MRPRRPSGRDAKRRLRRGALLAALLLPTGAACGIQPTGIIVLGAAPAAQLASPAAPFDTSPGSTQYLVFFYQNDRLAPAYRSTKGGVGVSERIVLEALVMGPTQAEQAAGYSSAVPSGLVAKPRANGLLGAYNLSQPLGQRAKSQFICTMQYYDQIESIGIQVQDSNVIWNACSDTTNQYIPMRGEASAAPSPGTGG
ncbi:MAG TPA: hypothetical protein VGS97_05455 [Actinocrinis sp.]|uniref:hypothetical protein n=1 Tax=Actinocrinis sp. TaxID=1920516 RepID=UPI002DDD4E01|nr:hypothetical protein [Actinocrinis sp.]HEV2343521.1 hypothetical protein [Actinocrinis sp.]